MNGPPRLRTWFRRTLLLATAATFASAAPAEILVASQNTLHLGQDSRAVPGYIAAKNLSIQQLATWPGSTLPHLTFLQEVMSSASETAIQPPGGTVFFGALKGTSTYLERYGVIAVNDAGNHLTILCRIDTAPLVSTGFTMARPPDAVLVRDTSVARTPQLIWFLNFHAIFGSGSAQRRAEAAEMGHIIARLRAAPPSGCAQTSQNVVAMGDWNLAATDRGFTDLARNAGFTRPQVSPNALTSLNAQGRRTSAYDHFVWDDAVVQVTLANLPSQPYCSTTASVTGGVIVPSNLLTFRQHCSDHLGVMAVVRAR
jgi:hypothetical protein